MEKTMKGMVQNSGTFNHKAKNQVKPASKEMVTRGGDLRSRPTGGSSMKKLKNEY